MKSIIPNIQNSPAVKELTAVIPPLDREVDLVSKQGNQVRYKNGTNAQLAIVDLLWEQKETEKDAEPKINIEVSVREINSSYGRFKFKGWHDGWLKSTWSTFLASMGPAWPKSREITEISPKR